MSSTDNDITLAMIMKHMQAMEGRIMQNMQGMELRLRDEFRSGLSRLESKVDRNHDIVMRNHAQTTLQIDNVDSRLDDLEVVQVPKLKKAVGMR